MLKVSGIFAAALLLAQPALSQVVTQQKPSAYCETPPYTGQGGKNCHSVWQEITAPPGYIFEKDSLKGGITSIIPGEHGECTTEWQDERKVIPGLTQPGRIRLKAYGERNSGFGTGGHTKCEYTVNMLKLPS
ncbi:hypothetical protein GL279_13195 [Paracoccus limosus]|uniref:Uncharacterized protein n=2 Tax=Paracoccus limosus TaxID=913252 RepID=A0A844HA45_9RHOB|nr:hypothetical protein [Paracoccus limosus]